MHKVPMPVLRRGGWLQVADHGAYSLAKASLFNGIGAADARRFYVWSKQHVHPGEKLTELRQGAARTVAAGVPERQLCLVATPEELKRAVE